MARIIVWSNGRKVVKESADPEDLPPSHAADMTLQNWRASATLTRRQTITGLVEEGHITAVEGRASSSQVPARVELTILAAYSTDAEREAARLTWLNFTEAQRNDPLVSILATIPDPDMTATDLDDFFETYSQI